MAMAVKMIDEGDVSALRMDPSAKQFREWARTYAYFVCAYCSQHLPEGKHPCLSLIDQEGVCFFQHHPHHRSRHLTQCGLAAQFDASRVAHDLKRTETMPIVPNLQVRQFMSLSEPKPDAPAKSPKLVTVTGEATQHRGPMTPMTAYGLVCSLNHRMGLMEHHPEDPDISIAVYLRAFREAIIETDIRYGKSPLARVLLVAGAQDVPINWLTLTREGKTRYHFGLVMGVINSQPTSKGPNVYLRLHGFDKPILISKDHWMEMLDGAKVKSAGQIIFKGRAVFVGRVRTDANGQLVSDDATIVGMTKKWIPIDSELELQCFTRADSERRHYSRPLGVDKSLSDFHHDMIFHDSVDRSGRPTKVAGEVRGMMDVPKYAAKQSKQDAYYKEHPDKVLWFWDTRDPMPRFPPRISSDRVTPLAAVLLSAKAA